MSITVKEMGKGLAMIVSHEHRFIFLKTNKTAGTSIEIALSKYCGPKDIITPIMPEDEKIRSKLGYPGPQNFRLPNQSPMVEEQGSKKGRVFFNHISAARARAYLGEKVWNDYFKFCVVRNPWDRVISGYYWQHRKAPRPSMKAFLKSRYLLLLKLWGYQLYTINGQLAVNRVGRYENLAEEMDNFGKRIGINEPLLLPRAKSGYRTDRRHYRDILDEEESVTIARLFQDEIRMFGYEF